MAGWLNTHLRNVYLINSAIGLLSSIVDNVPLVAGSMGMYDITLPGSTGYEAFLSRMEHFGNYSHIAPEPVVVF